MLMPVGGVLDRDGRTIGWVMPDGSVSNGKNSTIGKVMPDGTVIDLSGQTVARVAPHKGVALKSACEPAGNILIDGRVVDKEFKRSAYIQMNDTLVGENGDFIGRVAYGSRAISPKDMYLGTAARDGALYNPAGEKIGCLRPDSLFVNSDNKFWERPCPKELPLITNQSCMPVAIRLPKL